MVFLLTAAQGIDLRRVQVVLAGVAIATLGAAAPASAYMLNLASRAEALTAVPSPEHSAPIAGLDGLPTQPPSADDAASDREATFSTQTLRDGEVWATVNFLAFVHDAMEEIEMVRTPLDFSSAAYDQLSASTLSGSSDPAAQLASQPRHADALRTDLRLRSIRMPSSSSGPDESKAAQRDSEKREHELEARDATFGRQLQRDADQSQGMPAGTPVLLSGFDPAHNELGYARYYNATVADPNAEEDSSSFLVKLGLCLLAMGFLQGGLRLLLPSKVP